MPVSDTPQRPPPNWGSVNQRPYSSSLPSQLPPGIQRQSIERHKQNVNNTIDELAGVERTLQNISHHKRPSLPPPPVSPVATSTQPDKEVAIPPVEINSNDGRLNAEATRRQQDLEKHKDNVKKAISQLEQINQTGPTPKGGGLNPPGSKGDPPTASSKPKDSGDDSQKRASNAPPEPTKMKFLQGAFNSVKQRLMGSKEKEAIEETLTHHRYSDDLVPQKVEEPLSQAEKSVTWLEASLDRVNFHLIVLTLIASMLTSVACYMSIHLPTLVYSHHILEEIFYGSDKLIEFNSFSKGGGFKSIVLALPLAIFVMFVLIVYIIYMVQYPRLKGWLQIVRISAFILFELYLCLCLLSYVLGEMQLHNRLDDFFRHDNDGLLSLEGTQLDKLFYLDKAQTYLGCCGYSSRLEWEKVNATAYTGKWPLSCCDEKGSGIACYYPVELKVSYSITWVEGEDPEEVEDINRLHDGKCKNYEQNLSYSVSSIINVLILFFIALSSWVVVIVSRMVFVITKFDITMKQRRTYVDFL